MATRIVAQCPDCKDYSISITVGRKSTCRQVTCASCGQPYDYSAWTLRQDVYQVDLFHNERKADARA